MKSQLIAAGGALTLAVAAVSAQPQDRTPSTTAATNPARTVTVAGCLKPAGDSMSGTSRPGGTSGATGTDARYRLEDAEMKGGGAMGGSTSPGAPTAPGTPGTSTTGRTGMAADATDTYMVRASTTVNLAAHVNQKVEITGTLSDSTSDARGGADMTRPGTTPPTTSSRPGEATPTTRPRETTSPATGTSAQRMTGADGMQTIVATAVKMVSATCDGK